MPTPSDRRRDADRTRRDILDVARAEFADRGFSGARIDEIAARIRTTKRMIYYYFGSKEELFGAVLRDVYSEIRRKEQAIDVGDLEPAAAIRRLAELTFDHHEAHPDFIRLVSIENIHHAQHLAALDDRDELGSPAIAAVDVILGRGREDGTFRDDVDALDVHMIISAFCVFRVANRDTFMTLFDRDLVDPRRRARQRRMLGDLVVAHLTSTSA